MGNLDTTLKENFELKKRIEELVELVRENEAKQEGFRFVEYSFLMAQKLGELAGNPLKYLEEIFGFDRAVLFINKDELDFETTSDDIKERIYFFDTKVFRYFFLEKRPYVGSDLVHLNSEFKVYDKTQSYVIAPLKEGERIIGSINLYSRDKERYDELPSTDFIKELALIIAVSLRKLYNTELIFRQTRTDFLTGSYNKLAMTEFLEKFINRFERYGEGFHFILMDLDNFKLINDEAGHIVGDKLIKEISDELVENMRSSDIIGRFGGDEFYVIVPENEQIDIHPVMDKLTGVVRRVIRKYGFEGRADVSGGVFSLPGDEFSDGLESIIKIADDRLYNSKREGKGRFTGVDNNR